VHKIQFEKEFEIYKELWKKLYELRNKLFLLRPRVDRPDPSKSADEILEERYNNVTKIGREFIDITEENRPFYSEEIYIALNDVNRLVKDELLDVFLGDNRERKYWEQGEMTIKKYTDLIDEISVLIRKRIGNMK
jgi:hypothetical protein